MTGSPLAFLEQRCASLLGVEVQIVLEYGWGWSLGAGIDALELNEELYSSEGGKSKIECFIENSSCLIGFRGRYRNKGHDLDGWSYHAIVMCDGESNFESKKCDAWRFLFGDGELILEEGAYVLSGDKGIYGYGYCHL